MRHTVGQRFAIPDPAMQVIPFCTEVETLKVIFQQPALQSPKLSCANTDCFVGNAKYNKDEFDEEEGQSVGLMSFAAEVVAKDGRPHHDEHAKQKRKHKD